MSQTAPPPSTHNPLVPPALDAIVMKAMAKDPDYRHGSADELRADLLAVDRAVGDPDATAAIVSPVAADTTAVIAGPSTSVLQPPPAPERPVERVGPAPVPAEVYRRRRAGVILAVALAAVAVIAILVLLSGGDDDNPANVAVPRVEGLSVADATRALSGAGLRSQVTDREAPATADRVVDQDPDPGVMVSRDTTVTIFVPRVAGAPTTTSARPATTSAPATSITPTTAAPATTSAPATTQPPATTSPPAPTTSIVVPTTSATPTTARP